MPGPLKSLFFTFCLWTGLPQGHGECATASIHAHLSDLRAGSQNPALSSELLSGMWVWVKGQSKRSQECLSSVSGLLVTHDTWVLQLGFSDANTQEQERTFCGHCLTVWSPQNYIVKITFNEVQCLRINIKFNCYRFTENYHFDNIKLKNFIYQPF